jgi:hypothetical protein
MTYLGLAIGAFLAVVGVGIVIGPPTAVLLLAGLALAGVISFFWASLRTMLGETRLTGADAYALGAPRAEEEQKRSVLRALKDLEFERSVGKISEDDYRVLSVRYREEAKRLLRLIDENAAADRKRAQEYVTERLASAGLVSAEPAEGDAGSDDAPVPAPDAPVPAPESPEGEASTDEAAAPVPESSDDEPSDEAPVAKNDEASAAKKDASDD